jgi:hypothetical protein
MITLPLCLAICLWLAARHAKPALTQAPAKISPAIVCAVVSVGLGLYLLIGILQTDAASLRQTEGWGPVFFGNILETFPTFFVAPSTTAWIYLSAAMR